MLAFRRAKPFQIFRLFRLSILNPIAGNQSTPPHCYDIQTPVDARYGRSEAPELVYTSDSLVIAPTSLSLPFGPAERNCLASCGTLQMALRDGFLRATSVLIGRLVDRLAVVYLDTCRIEQDLRQRGRCYVEGGIVSWIEVCS